MKTIINLSSTDRTLIIDVAMKASKAIMVATGRNVSPSLITDFLAVAHLNGTPLRLNDMAKGRDIDIIHDVTGIIRHLDTRTGQLTDGFLPRYAKAF